MRCWSAGHYNPAMKTWQKWAIGVSSVTLALTAGTGIAMAAIPDSGGVIHGCYKPNSNGSNSALGVIDTVLSGGHCPTGDTALTWNQTGPQGPQGATGATGATGAQGPAGPSGMSGYQIVTAAPSSGYFSTIGAAVVATVTCPAGEKAISGGGTTEDTSGNITAAIADSAPLSDGSGWRVTFYVPSNGSNSNDEAYAVCADVSP